MSNDLEKVQKLLLDVFFQACEIGELSDGRPFVNHQHISAYERAQAYLLAHGYVAKEQCQYDT